MSYEKGDLKLIEPCPTREKSEYNYCECEDVDHHAIYDYDHVALQSGVYLPHSCDEWVIGGLEEVETMIEDLEEIKKQLRPAHTCKSRTLIEIEVDG